MQTVPVDTIPMYVGQELGKSDWLIIDQDRINAFADPAQARKDFVARQPMGRLATAEELAETFVYLVSDESSFMTGQAVFVDGGMSL